jgi:hypothetical protein
MASADGQHQPTPLQSETAQIIDPLQDRGRASGLKRTLQPQQRLLKTAADLLQISADLRGEGMGGIHHPSERTPLPHESGDRSFPLEGTDGE